MAFRTKLFSFAKDNIGWFISNPVTDVADTINMVVVILRFLGYLIWGAVVFYFLASAFEAMTDLVTPNFTDYGSAVFRLVLFLPLSIWTLGFIVKPYFAKRKIKLKRMISLLKQNKKLTTSQIAKALNIEADSARKTAFYLCEIGVLQAIPCTTGEYAFQFAPSQTLYDGVEIEI
jgi:hypothetical protein